MANQAVLDPPRRPTAAASPRPRLPRRLLLRLTLMVAVLHAYIGLRLLPALALDTAESRAAIMSLVLTAALIPLTLMARRWAGRLPRRLEDALVWSGLIAAGLGSSLLVLTVLRDLALLPTWLLLAPVPFAEVAQASAAGVLGLAASFSAIGLINARRTPRVVEVGVPIADLPPALDGFRIVQLSDLHIGPTIRGSFLQRIVTRVNALDADLVALTGDLVDGRVADLAAHTAALGDLRARHGCFAVTGNHEYYAGADAWIAEFRRLGLHVLHNEHTVLTHAGATLVVAGVSDFSGHQFGAAHRSDPHAAIAGAPAPAPRVLLAHQPRSAPAAAAAGFDLQLSGHTHGGQFFPWNFFVPLQQPYTAGLHRLDRLWVYTSRGTGYWGPPKRLGAPAEITLLRLTAAPAQAAPST